LRDELSDALFAPPRRVDFADLEQADALSRLLLKNQERLERLPIQALTFQDLIDLAGLPNTSIVENTEFGWNTAGELSIGFQSQCDRFGVVIQQEWVFASHEPYIYIDRIRIEPTGEGIGARILLHQIHRARRLGFQAITLLAVRASNTNGYYTWPRLGFDSSLGQCRDRIQQAFEDETGREFPADVRGVTDLIYGFEDDIGLNLWSRFGGSLDMTFDLRFDSSSSLILEEYCNENRIGLASGW
jgi:hypothetical protein